MTTFSFSPYCRVFAVQFWLCTRTLLASITTRMGFLNTKSEAVSVMQGRSIYSPASRKDRRRLCRTSIHSGFFASQSMRNIDRSNPNVAVRHIMDPTGNSRIDTISSNQVLVCGDIVNFLEQNVNIIKTIEWGRNGRTEGGGCDDDNERVKEKFSYV